MLDDLDRFTRPFVPASRLECAGCGQHVSTSDLTPFRCPNAGRDDTDHVLVRRLDPSSVRFVAGAHPNPFVRYRELLHGWHVGRSHGASDAACVDTVERLDRAVAALDGRGFVVTPFGRAQALSEALGLAGGGVWVKDETRNVAGSHKARHLMGLALYLEAMRMVRRATAPGSRAAPRARLAIASCGNAALAAAVVGRAAGWELDVFVPVDAEPPVLARLAALGARIVPCGRTPGVAGDPCLARFHEAVAAGALPFTVQGSENGLAIEGGATLGYEIVESLRAGRLELERVFVQVGGGALASAVIQAFSDARAIGVTAATPRIHTVQTRSCHPLRRAYERVRARVLVAVGATAASPDATGARADARPDVALARDDHRCADLMRRPEAAGAVAHVLRHALRHRSEFMGPWEPAATHAPASLAYGILDDETYDWYAVVRGMIETGGWPLVVSEDTIRAANGLAHTATGIRVSHTGSAGLAGLVDLVRCGVVAEDERIAVLFTGVER